jgi:hypothetical protein
MRAEGADVNRMLDGWREVAPRPDSLRWLRAQLDATSAFSSR